MGRRSSVLKMPVKLRLELDERLRNTAYGDYLVITEWLATNGYEVSKSALHRYGSTLRHVDARNGNQDAQVAEVAKSSGNTTGAIRTGLLLELGRLRYQEAQIIEKLWQLDNGTMQN